MNDWKPEFRDYGVITVNGNSIKVFCNNWEHIEIPVGEPVADANWAGNCVIIRLSNGTARRYFNHHEYITIQ